LQNELTLGEILDREGIIGGDIELYYETNLYRGRISSIEIRGDEVLLVCPWSVRRIGKNPQMWTLRTAHKFPFEKRYFVEVNNAGHLLLSSVGDYPSQSEPWKRGIIIPVGHGELTLKDVNLPRTRWSKGLSRADEEYWLRQQGVL
jgi:hypothetical protein